MTGESTPPDSEDFERDDLEAKGVRSHETPLVPESPLPRCLTDGAELVEPERARASGIPPAPRVPSFSFETAEDPQGLPRPPASASLGLPSDRVLPGSAALISTFRPKPVVRVCYSLTRSLPPERVFRPRPGARGRTGTKKDD